MQRATQVSYQQALGAIGRYMDQHGYEDLVLCELSDGYVARMMRDGNLVEAVPFAMSDVIGLIRANESAAVTEEASTLAANAPVYVNASFVRRVLGGYRGFLSALGRQCDALEAHTIMIIELRDALVVAFQKPASSYEIGEASMSEFIYDEAGLLTLMSSQAR